MKKLIFAVFLSVKVGAPAGGRKFTAEGLLFQHKLNTLIIVIVLDQCCVSSVTCIP